MQGNRRRDTSPEWRIRRLLHAQGLRYRVDLPLSFDRRRRADLTFTRARVVVFIDGCFWHGCPEHYVEPKSHVEYWSHKVAGNAARDIDTNARLRADGWTVLRFWEHQDAEQVAATVMAAVRVDKEIRMSETAPAATVRDNPEEAQYEILIGSTVAGYSEYRLESQTITFFHTEVSPDFGGQGLGGKLAAAALADVRARGLAVIPECPFIRGYIRKHPEFLDLVPADRHAEFHLHPAE